MNHFSTILIQFFLFQIVRSDYKCGKIIKSKPQIEPSDCQSALMGFDRFSTGTIHYNQSSNSKSCGACHIRIRSSDGTPLHASTYAAFKALDGFMKACPYAPGEFAVHSNGIRASLIMEVHPAAALQC